ncbi:MAG: MFS transporter [Steroidobacteraceae bacterium]
MTTAIGRHPDDAGRLRSGLLALYAAPNLALVIMHMPVYLVLPAYYAKHTQISLAAIGTVLLVGRLYDAIVDLLLGVLSDRTETRIGGRKPWILAGIPIACVAVIQLFTPPADAGTLYFLVWSVLLFSAWTMIDIPYAAWGAELSRHYDERSRIMTVRGTAGLAGAVLFMAAPILLSPLTGTTAIGSEMLAISAWAVALSLPLLMGLAVWRVPAGPNVAVRKASLRSILDALRDNRPLRLYSGVVLGHGAAAGAWSATVLLFCDSIGLGAQFPLLLLVAWTTRVLVAPLWLKLLYRFGKHRVWAVGAAASGIVTPLALLVPAGESALPLILVYSLALGFIETAWMVAPSSILGDITDYDTLKTGADQAGAYFAFNALLMKVSAAIGGGVAFWVLGLLDYNVKGSNSGTQLLGLHLSFAILPAAIYVLCAVAIWWFPIDARRHSIIRRRIEARARRQQIKAGHADAAAGGATFPPQRLSQTTPA